MRRWVPGMGGGGGSLDLSAVAQHYVITADGTYDIGSTSAALREVFSDKFTANDDGTVSAPAFGFASDNAGFYQPSGATVAVCGSTAQAAQFESGLGMGMRSGALLWWGSNGSVGSYSTRQVVLSREADGVLGLGDSTDAFCTIGKSDQQQTAAADTDGIDTYITGESGGTHTSNNPDGGSLIWVGGAAGGGTGTPGALYLAQVSAEPTVPGSNMAGLYAVDGSGTTELYTQDEAGNETLQTPHATDAPADMYDDTPGKEIMFKYVNSIRGECVFLNFMRLAKEVERLAGKPGYITKTESFSDYGTRTGKVRRVVSWEERQDKLQAKYDRKRAKEIAARNQWEADRQAEINAKAAYDALSSAGKAKTQEPSVRPIEDRPAVREAKDIRKPKPAQLN